MYDEAADDHDMPTLNTCMLHISSFNGQVVIQLLNASQAAYRLKVTNFVSLECWCHWKQSSLF